MRTRHQRGNLQLEKRSKGPDVWIYRWREYLPDGKIKRWGELVGTVKEFPTKADAFKACGRLYLKANGAEKLGPSVAFGVLLDCYLGESYRSGTARNWPIAVTSKTTYGRTGSCGH
jgi:hypothetical protein